MSSTVTFDSFKMEEDITFQDGLKKNEILHLNLFWGGFLLYAFGSIVTSAAIADIKLCQAIQLLGFAGMAYASVFLVKFKMDSGYLRFFFVLYFGWSIITIFRQQSLTLNYDFVKNFLFGGANGGLLYVTPIILLFPRSLVYYKKLFDALIVFAVLYFLLDVVFIKKLLVRGDDIISQSIIESVFEIGIPVSFILLTFLYHSNRTNLIAAATIALTLLLVVIRARRGLILITSTTIFFCYIFYFFGAAKKLLIVYFSAIVFIGGALYAANLYKLQKSFLGFMYERGTEDTRTNVELYFYDDMKTNDWIAGRGMDGEYFCPNIEEFQATNYRNVIETGYLQIILKGGLISLVLLLLITFPAVILGIFYSNNILAKAAGVWIFQFILNLYPQISTTFNLSYILVWISVGICYSKEIRTISNESIKNILKNLPGIS